MPASPANNRLKFFLLMSAGIVIASMLLLIVFSIDTPKPSTDPSPAPRNITELISPGALTPEDLTGGITDLARNPNLITAQRGNIQAMHNNRLWEYRFDALDPLPNGWSKMRNPRIMGHLADHRILTLQSDSATILMPAKSPESGGMSGNVIIRLYELGPGEHFDLNVATPSMEVRTNEANFDNLQGEVRCDGPVDIQTPTAHVPGSGLRLQINEIEHRPEWLSLAKTGTIRLSHFKDESLAPSTQPQPGIEQSIKNNRSPKKQRAGSQPESELPQFFRLTLQKNIRIRQRDDATGWTAHGDDLQIIFSMNSESLSDSPAAPPMPPPDSQTREPEVNRVSPDSKPIASAISEKSSRHLDPASGIYQATVDEITITCDEGLIMIPLPDSAPVPDSADDAQLQLTGAPVRIHIAAENADITCASLAYETRRELLQLSGTPIHQVKIESPQLQASSDRFSFNRRTNAAAFEGPGWMIMQDDPNTADVARNVRVDWQNRADLTFEKTPSTPANGQLATKAALRSAAFVGNVIAQDQEHQTVHSDHLDIAFHESDASNPAAAKVKTLIASGNVQVILADGSLAFADRLEGNPDAQTAILTGQDVMIVSDHSVLHHGRSLELRQADSVAQWTGSGEFLYFTHPIVAAIPGAQPPSVRLQLQQIDQTTNPLQMRAKWNDEMIYNGAMNDGAGEIVLRGAVEAQSTPTPLERNTMNGDVLTLQFIRKQMEPEPTSPAADTIEGKRKLKQLIADGNAKLESHTWLNTDHSDPPRIFYVAGPQIVYDGQTTESKVIGAGELLIRDEQFALNAVDSSGIPFSSKGTTLMRWRDRLEMTRTSNAMYDIIMTGEVEIRHKAMDETISKLTAPELRATAERLSPADTETIALGGSMRLHRLHGAGGIYIDAPTRDIDCDEFDYDYAAGAASLTARPGRTVAISTKGNPAILRATSVIWNLIDDIITATNVAGE